ncbi:DUF7149 domain-containing protein [Thermoflexibacter ruber]|uniref:site-specific DNA-methyltransferase (adenine-specific) n=1 Tax=Thermoflexibacter ruber TaxID=1003 RepID=A0A1I2AAS0_9BACT|nr:TaqI-like C-terminal specificity domain-containing protein [Thermoflexibacter ruber]SFE40966.1 Eco57I restriction-modification methylase [Thermoflexibacter ruber]
MTVEVLTPQQSISEIYQAHYLVRREIDLLKSELGRLFSRIDENESEEHFKNITADFLKTVFYKTDYEVNTKNRKDLVIHNGKSVKDAVGVIIEAKKPSNKAEMFSAEKPNAKALHELILDYFEEREEKDNIEIKYLIITNLYEWFIFDENGFDKAFYRNTEIKKLYKSKKEQGKDNPFFYTELAKILSQVDDNLKVTYFNLKDYQQVAALPPDDEQDLVFEHLWKVLSPAHLLKLPLSNDANTLNQPFYNELLHILGLEEVIDKSQGGKKLIKRIQKESERSEGSMMENVLYIISLDKKWQHLPNLSEYGDTPQEQLEEIAISLCITWLNRILFLKLLEGQLLTYKINEQVINEKEQGKSANPVDLSKVRFLHTTQIKDFDELHELFFEVLAVKKHERNKVVSEKFGEIPYLNSSLFEEIELEEKVLKINQLKNRLEIPLYSQTVLKKNGKRLTGKKRALEYLFDFLGAFDFAKTEKNKIQEESKDLINSAVLGLVFEQLNGYKEGSFFTPSFITMYMCRETIRKVVVQKFKQANIGFEGDSFEDLKMFLSKDNYKSDRLRLYNQVFNSIKICDPAVGSGHFLVAALNELIACKSELQIIASPENMLLGFLQIEIQNDELRVKNLQLNEEHAYRKPPQNFTQKPYYQVIQETLFHEKKTLIENCLFGVDINPNSVKICRLRLWIELLKNAYYQAEPTPKGFRYTELETLPNIDINIKVGNSLISRFALDDKYQKLANGARQKLRLATQKYKEQVIIYKNTTDPQTKQNAEKEIANIKKLFSTTANPYDKDYQLLKEKEAQLGEMPLFFDRKEQETWIENTQKLTQEVEALRKKHEEKLQTVYGKAFEWRFEFPEVLNEDGDFEGFDFVVGNPPYSRDYLSRLKKFFDELFETSEYKIDPFVFFIERGTHLLYKEGWLNMIVPNTWLNTDTFSKLRHFLLNKTHIEFITNLGRDVFPKANVDTCIVSLNNFNPIKEVKITDASNEKEKDLRIINYKKLFYKNPNDWFKNKNYIFDIHIDSNEKVIIEKLLSKSILLGSITEISQGLIPYNKREQSLLNPYISTEPQDETWKPFLDRGNCIGKYSLTWNGLYVKFGSWLYTANHPKFYENEKILIQRHRNPTLKTRIIATYDNQGYYYKDNLCGVILKTQDYDLKFLLAVLNSSTANFYYKKNHTEVSLNPTYLKQIPIPQLSAAEQVLFVDLVEQILTKKKQGQDTSQLEREIDERIFDLYGLSEEEKKWVSNS